MYRKWRVLAQKSAESSGRDRDGKFCDSFRGMVKDAGVEPVRLPPRSPDLNAHLERFMRSVKQECLGRLIFFGETSLRNAVRQFVEHHYRHERNHKGLGNEIIEPGRRSVG